MKIKSFGTQYIARACSVSAPTVIRWIEEKRLPSYNTLGGHRRVWDEDLREFLAASGIPLPEGLKALRAGILIVDGEEESRRLISRTIKRHFGDVDITEASDGFEAGQKLEALKPSILIIDIEMPGIDGLKACQKVRQDYKGKIKILAVSGRRHKANGEKSLKMGADAFLPKPFEIPKLIDTVKRLLKR